MALLNNYYIFVQDEDVKRGVSISEHPVESGLDITDNVKRSPMEINISGEIVGKDAKQVLAKITDLHQSGEYVKYIGQNILSKALITAFDTSHPNTIYGGCAFSMTIREVRIAKKPKIVKKVSAKKQVTPKSGGSGGSKSSNKTYTVKKGDTLWAIATKYYGSGGKYTKIVDANKSLIKNPNLIYVGWVLTIPA
jgi:LysM repeat protein